MNSSLSVKSSYMQIFLHAETDEYFLNVQHYVSLFTCTTVDLVGMGAGERIR